MYWYFELSGKVRGANQMHAGNYSVDTLLPQGQWYGRMQQFRDIQGL